MKRAGFLKQSAGLFWGVVFGQQALKTNKRDNIHDMKNARELMTIYHENIHNPDELIKHFADDAAVELPYLKSIGLEWQWRGKDTLHKFFQNLPKQFQGFKFEDIKILIVTPDQVFAEYSVHCTVVSTGRPYNQTYMGRLVAENGKIKLIREGMDMVQVAKSMLPNGLSDMPRS